MSFIFELQSSFGALHWLHILFNQISNEVIAIVLNFFSNEFRILIS